MQQHIKIVAILNIVYGALIALAGVVVLAIFGSLAGIVGASASDRDAAAGAGVLGAIGLFVTVLLIILGAPSIVAGWGLLKYYSWARIMTIVLSGFHLVSVPFGTALGIYGLWTLLKPESEALFRQPAQSAPPMPMG